MTTNSAIVEDYAQSLNELTFNSRPIIQNLTNIASENKDVADGIMNSIINRIYKAIPEQKLFALYLLDSVSKFGGEPYNILIGEDLFKIFSHVFMVVNEQTRQKVTKIFEIWKISKTMGSDSPLFPKSQLDKIQSFLNQAGYSSNANDPTKKALVDDIDTLIPVFQRKLNENKDPKLKDRYNALYQLKELLINNPLKANELKAVHQQLSAIKQQELNIEVQFPTPAATPGPVHLPPIPPKPVSTRAYDLFSFLIASGLVKVDQSLIPGSKPTYEAMFPEVKYEPPSNKVPTSNDLQDILMNSSLLNSGIQRSQYDQKKAEKLARVQVKSSKDFQAFITHEKLDNATLSLLYDAQPSKCGICGKRFTSDELGSTRKRLHLDWHFRVNKKLSSNSASVQSRNWYLDDYDWVKFKDENLLEYSTTNNKTPQSIITSKKEKEEVPYVIVPATETNMINQCQICREQVKATYNDDIGEWCWLNCMRAPGESKNSRKIFHVACYNEANRKRTALDDLNENNKRGKF